MAELVANRILKSTAASDQQLKEAFALVLNRSPATDEFTNARQFLTDSGDDALTQLCLALLNSNEFVFAD